MKLKRDLSKFNLLLLSIGSIIGSGWMFGSFYTARIAGPGAILSWLIGGFLVAVIALSLSEIISMFPMSGGSTVFVTLSHGKFAGSLFSWITWLWSLVVAPIEVQAILQYASNYLPEIIKESHQLSNYGLAWATVLMLVMVTINMFGIRFMAEANNLIVYWKLVVPLSIALFLIFYKPHFENLTAVGGFFPNGIAGVFSGIATGGVAISYFGFQNSIFLAGEAKNPHKTIPFALLGSLITCAVIYTLLQISFVVATSPESLQNGWSSMNFIGDAGPFAGIFAALGIPFMIVVLYFDAVVSPFGTGISYVAASSRILYSMGLQGDAPTVVAKTNRFSIPWFAIATNFVFGMMFFLPFSGWQEMASFLSAAIILSLSPGPICLPIFRKSYADLKRPFQVKWYRFLSFATFYICCLILHWTGWNTIWKLEVILAFGCIVQFFLHFSRSKKLDFDIKTTAWLWIPVYLALAGIISYLGAYGGGRNIIKAGDEFIVILFSSAIIYFIAQKFTISTQHSRKMYNIILDNHTARRNTPKSV